MDGMHRCHQHGIWEGATHMLIPRLPPHCNPLYVHACMYAWCMTTGMRWFTLTNKTSDLIITEPSHALTMHGRRGQLIE